MTFNSVTGGFRGAMPGGMICVAGMHKIDDETP